MKQEEFKNFVRTKPELIKYVQNGKMTWQKFYEMYDLYGEDNIVYISIYDRDNNNYYNEIVKTICDNREDNKKLVIDMVTNMLKKVV